MKIENTGMPNDENEFKKRDEFLSFSVPTIGEEEINEVVDTLKSGWITTGPKTKLFEDKLKNYTGAKFALAVNSCTAALHLSLIAAGIEKGDEVITSPLTFVSTANVILYLRAKPVFVDIDENTFNMDVNLIESKITEKTKAIIPVHYAGHPCDMDKINEIAKKHNLIVIEDAAHAIGSEYKNEKIGKNGDLVCFSFYPIKNMTTGEGGAIMTNNEDFAKKIDVLRLHGIAKDAWKRYTSKGSWYYEVVDLGYKYNLTDMQSALGLHQIDKLDNFIERRNKLVEIYEENFKDVSEIKTQKVSSDIKHARHIYPILINNLKINRAEFIKRLTGLNVGTSMHFIPVHLHPYYRKSFGYKEGDFPIAEKVYNNLITLPLYPRLSEEDVNYVVSAVKKIIEENKI